MIPQARPDALPGAGTRILAASRRCAFDRSGPPLSAAQVIAASLRCTAVSRDLPLAQTAGCQPLGAWHCAQGFTDCLPVLLDGSACLAHFNRFLERQGYLLQREALDKDAATAPSTASAPFSSPTVLEAIFSTCLARTPPVHWSPAGVRHSALAQTPSFVGSQAHGWDAMFEALLKALGPPQPATRDSVNLVLGFEQLPHNYDVMEQLFDAFGLPCQLLSDPRFSLAADRAPRTNPQGTSLEALQAAPGARHTLIVRPWQLPRSQALISERWGHSPAGLPIPMGLTATDAWLDALGELAGRIERPAPLADARQALIAQLAAAREPVARRRIALCGEPDFVLGLARLLRDLNSAPALLICPNGDRHWLQAMEHLLGAAPPPIVTGQAPQALTEGLIRSGADLLIAPPGFNDLRGLRDDNRLARLPLVDLDQRPGPGPRPATLGYTGATFMLQRLLEATG